MQARRPVEGIFQFTKLVLEHASPRDGTYGSMLEFLPEKEGRFVVYDYEVTLEDGRKSSRLVLIYWCPLNMAVHGKMVMSTNKSTVQGKLECQLQLLADSKAEVDEKEISSLVKSKI